MALISWDQTGERFFETGVDHGVLYPYSTADKTYSPGVPWNGLTAINETPSGAEPTPIYADNMKYLNLMSAEEFGFTIEAFTYPDEFALCDGTATPAPGVAVAQQERRTFGLSYRTLVGNDIESTNLGYKLHLIWGALASPSEKAYSTVNDTPEAITFSWTGTTTPEAFPDSLGLKPSAQMTIDSTKVDAGKMAALEAILYGSDSIPAPEEGGEITPATIARLPLPAEIIALMTD